MKQAQRNANKNNAENNINMKKSENQNENHAPIPTLSFAQLKKRCYCCEKRDTNPLNTNTKTLFLRKIGLSQKQKGNLHNQTIVCVNNNESTITTKESTISISKQKEKQIGWANLHFSFFQSQEMKELVLLDSNSTYTVFCNRNYVTNIRKSDRPLILK